MVYQLKIQLLNVKKPPVWRRVLVPADISFDNLHIIIQYAMGWGNEHLYQFGYKAYDSSFGISLPNEYDFERPKYNAARTPVSKFLNAEHPKMKYTYDFGDDWIHDVILEKQFGDADVKEPLPYCVAAKGACPPEDCGGPWEYERIKEEALSGDAEEEMLMWYEIDPENPDFVSVDIENINSNLSEIRVKRIRKPSDDKLSIKQTERIKLLNELIENFSKAKLDGELIKECKKVIDQLSDSKYDITSGRADIWAAAIILISAEVCSVDLEMQEVLDFFGLKSAGVLSRMTNIRDTLYNYVQEMLEDPETADFMEQLSTLVEELVSQGYSFDEAMEYISKNLGIENSQEQ